MARTLSSTLLAAQKGTGLDALVKIVLTQGANSYTYTKTRIKTIDHREDPWSQKAEVVLNDSDLVLNALNLRGYKGVISYGAATSGGDEYSACAPLYVMAHEMGVSGGRVASRLYLKGVPDLMDDDKASVFFLPTLTHTLKDLIDNILKAANSAYSHCTAYTADFMSPGTASVSSASYGTAAVLFDNLWADFWETTTALPAWIKYDFGAGLGKVITVYTLRSGADEPDRMPKDFTFQGSNNDSDWTTLDTQTSQSFSASEKKIFTFSNSTAYRYYRINITAVTETPYTTVRVYDVWMSSDSLLETFLPKQNIRIPEGMSRLAILKKLLQYCQSVMLFKADEKPNIFVPVTSGSTYDYSYSLASGDHPFLGKEYRQKLVFPNYVTVASYIGDVPAYSGEASDPSYSLIRRDAPPYRMRLTSNAQAQSIAEAIIAKAQLATEGGAASIPNNVGAEVFDYSQVTDPADWGANVHTGNLGFIHRKINLEKNEWKMNFGFGGWLEKQKVSNNLVGTALAGWQEGEGSLTNIALAGVVTNVGDTLVQSNDTQGSITVTDYTKVREIIMPCFGYLRIKFDLQGIYTPPLATAYGKIYRNGSALGTEQSEATENWTTYSEDFDSFKPGDLIQLYVKKVGAGTGLFRNFRIYLDNTGQVMPYTPYFVNQL